MSRAWAAVVAMVAAVIVMAFVPALANADISVTEGATFTDATVTNIATSIENHGGMTCSNAATIDWNDGSNPSSGAISESGDVTGSHTYIEEGRYTATVTWYAYDSVCAPGQPVDVTFIATVGDAGLDSSGVAINGTAGAPFSGTVATFGDADPAGAVGDYTAVVEWGDGSTSLGTPVAGPTRFTIAANHTYAATGLFTVAVTIQDMGGATTTTLTTASVAAAPPSNTGMPQISGSPQVGETIVCSPGAWAGTLPISYAYRWFRDGAPIVGATGSAYDLAVADLGHSVACGVTATNSAGTADAVAAAVSVTARPVSVALGCAPAPIAAGQTTTCTATVTDGLGAGAGPPSGLVTFGSSAGAGFGAGATCMLAGGGPSASCALPYRPGVVGTDTITVAYAGDSVRQGARGSIDLTVTPLPKSGAMVAVACSPGTVTAGQTTTCTAIVTPDAGVTAAPMGAVTFTISGAGGVSGGGGCTLVGARCSVSYTLGPSASGTYTVNAVYSGGGTYATGSAVTDIAAAPVPGVTANITVLSGTVEIKLLSSSTFVPLTSRGGPPSASSYVPIKGATVSVPVGSTIDAHRKGRVRLATAADYHSGNHPAHTVQTGIFTAATKTAAIFSIEQMTIRQALKRLHAKHKRLGPAATGLRLRTPAGAVSRARCRRHGAPGKGVVREVSGIAKGVWRTVGARSITTVHDTRWVVEDRCDGTLTEVGRGRANVTATGPRHGRQHPIVVNAGQGVLIKGRFL